MDTFPTGWEPEYTEWLQELQPWYLTMLKYNTSRKDILTGIERKLENRIGRGAFGVDLPQTLLNRLERPNAPEPLRAGDVKPYQPRKVVVPAEQWKLLLKVLGELEHEYPRGVPQGRLRDVAIERGLGEDWFQYALRVLEQDGHAERVSGQDGAFWATP